jgi:hypothetical protein
MSDEELKALLDDETWMTAEDAKAFGFADEVTDALDVQNLTDRIQSLNLDKFTKTPKRIAAMAQHKPAAVDAVKTGEKTMTVENSGAATDTAPKVQSVDTAAIVAEAKIAERQRAAGIVALGTTAGLSRDGIDKIVALDLSVEASAVHVINAAAEKQRDGKSPITGMHAQATVVADAADKFRDGAIANILARAGVKQPQANNEFSGMSLQDLSREFCVVNNLDHRGSADQVTRRVFAYSHGTSDFKQILVDAANKSLLIGYEEQPEIFEQFCKIGSVNDFKPHHRVQLNSFSDLARIEELGEYTEGKVTDRGQTIQAHTFGRNLFLSRQAIVNDDLGAFTEMPRKMGQAARRTIGQSVINILSDNPAMDDGVALFHVDKNNLVTSALGEASLITALTAMRKQTDGNAVLNLAPQFLIVAANKEIEARQLVESPVRIGKNNAEPNPLAGKAVVLVDGRLPDNKWYLAASPNVIDTIEVAYLNGQSAPFIDTQDGWNVDGMHAKVRHDFGTRALDFRGLYKGNASA